MKEGFSIVVGHPRFIRSTVACLVLPLGLGCIGGCGGGNGTNATARSEKVPVGIEKLKETMKARMAAKKGGSGGQKGTAGRR